MDRESDRIRYLEMLYEWQRTNDGVPYLRELFGRELDEQELRYWLAIVSGTVDQGLVRSPGGMGPDVSGFLTPEGEEFVERVREERRRPAARRKAADNALLRWIDRQDQRDTSWMHVTPALGRLFFLGDPFDEQELFSAAKRLAEDGLVKGAQAGVVINGFGQFKMTSLGRRCAESDMPVDEFLRHERRQEPSVHNEFSGQFHSSNIAASSSNFTQTLSSSGQAVDDLKVMVQAVLESLPVLGLSEDQAREVQRSAAAIQGELERAKPDAPMVKTLMGRIVDGIGEGAKTATAASLSLLIKWQLARMGFPLEG